MRKVKCAVCGRIFETDRPRAKYCSLECKAKGAAEHRAIWLKANKGYNRKYYLSHRYNLKNNSPEAGQLNDLPPEQ